MSESMPSVVFPPARHQSTGRLKDSTNPDVLPTFSPSTAGGTRQHHSRATERDSLTSGRQLKSSTSSPQSKQFKLPPSSIPPYDTTRGTGVLTTSRSAQPIGGSLDYDSSAAAYQSKLTASLEDTAVGAGGGAGVDRMPSSFQMEFIRGLIREEMEEFRDEMRRSVISLHFDMIKQFQIQQVG